MKRIPATAHDGVLVTDPIHRQYLREREGKVFDVIERKTIRSQSQNSYYWLYLGLIEQETGNLADDLHEFLKRKLLPPQFKTVLGVEVKLPASTTELSKAEFGEYLDKIAALTGVPLPDPAEAGFISEYGPRNLH